MPTITNPRLTLTERNGRVTIRVRYDATFSEFERALVGLGLSYHSHVSIHDFDGGDGVGATLVDFDPRHTFPVTQGSGQLVLPGDEAVTVDRSALEGDPSENDDEVKAKIRIHTEDAIVAFTPDVLTEQEILAD